MEPVKLYYETKGSGPPVVMLHGFGASGYTWRYLAEPLSEFHQVITIDLKGFGKSPKPLDGKYSLDHQVDLVHEVITELGLSTVTLMGHSYGGAVSLALAIQLLSSEPGRLKNLVIISGAAYLQRLPSFIKILKVPVLGNLSLNLISRETQVMTVLKACVYDITKITDEMVNNYARPLYEKGGFNAMVAVAKQIFPENASELTARYPDINVPALLIWGREDQVVPMGIGTRLHADLPQSRLEIIDRCGHIPQEEKPETTLELIHEFLAADGSAKSS